MQYDRGPAALTESPGPARAPRLLDEVRRCLRLKRYSLRTEQAYLYWIRRYIRTNGFSSFICESVRCAVWKSSIALRTTMATYLATARF